MDEIDLNDDEPSGSQVERTDSSPPGSHKSLGNRTGSQSGSPHRLQPKTSAENFALPTATRRISLPTEDSSHDGNPDNRASVPPSERYSGLTHHSAEENGHADHAQEAEAAAPDNAWRPPKPHASPGQRVGGKVSPPNPYSEEARAAEASLAAEVAQMEQDMAAEQRQNSYANGSLASLESDSSATHSYADIDRTSQQAASHLDEVQRSLNNFGLEPRDSWGYDPNEPVELRGMLYHDGLDSLGRPVIVINSDAVAANVSRRWACQYIMKRLEPIVSQGPYVLVMVNSGSKSKRLPAGWLVSTYRSLPRPFRKNVKYIVLVRPSGMLKTLLAFIRPFVSGKAHRKVCKVESLSGIATATNHEVTIQHLGPRFAAAAGRFIAEGLAKSPRHSAPGSSTNNFAMPSMD